MPTAKSARGRPRDPATRKKILAAARELLNGGGMSAVTMEAVAAKAGVGKPTIYREWPNAQSVAMEAFLDTTKPQEQGRKRGKALDALRDQLHSIIKTFSTPTGRNTAMMIAAAQNDSELAKIFRNRFIMGRREEGRGILRAAVQARELRPDIDYEVTLDLIYAPLFFRLLIGHGPLDKAYADAILDAALKGLKVRRG
jgi:AcrR family transcriptional regulator